MFWFSNFLSVRSWKLFFPGKATAMRLCFISSIAYQLRVCRGACLFLNFSSSCALNSIDFSDESNGDDCDYLQLQRRMQNYAAVGDLANALQALNSMRNVAGKPTVYDYNALIYRYLGSRNVMLEELVQVYVGMKRFGPAPNASTFNILLNGILSLGKVRAAYELAIEMNESGVMPSYTCLRKLLKSSLKLGYLVESLSVFKFMLKLNYFAAEPTLTTLISMLCKAGMLLEAYSVFSALLVEGFVGVYIYNPILWALCKSGQTSSALRLFYWMKKRNIVQNVCSYTAIIYGLGKEGMNEDLFRFVDIMKRDGFMPNVITYTVVVDFFCRRGKICEAFVILDCMERGGCGPDLITCNVILRELCRRESLDDVCEFLQRIYNRGFSPDSYTHAALAGSLLKTGKVRTAYKLLLDVISRGVTLDDALCNILLRCLCLNNVSGEIFLKVLYDMGKKGIKFSAISCTCLIQYFGTLGKISECLMVLESMMRYGPTPNTITFNVLLDKLCKNRLLGTAYRIYEQRGKASFFPDTISYNILIHAAVKEHNISLVSQLLADMYNQRVELDIITYRSLACLFWEEQTPNGRQCGDIKY